MSVHFALYSYAFLNNEEFICVCQSGIPENRPGGILENLEHA